MKQLFLTLFALVSLSAGAQTSTQEITIDPTLPKAEARIFVITDAGRNGSFDQRRIGRVMSVYADSLGPEMVLNCGDMFHYDGIQSTSDPLLISNFESIYPAGELQCPWWGVLGNHEYRGNTQAVIDYTNISRRWNVPSRYYARTFEGATKKDSVLIVFMDTAPMIDKYRTEGGYPDAEVQDPERQVAWIDSTLGASGAKWKFVVGHHPVYSYSKKDKEETDQMQARVAAIFEKRGVNASFSGHVHTFQHLQVPGKKTDYFVCPSASLGRAPIGGEYTKHNNDQTGFVILSLNKAAVTLSMVNRDGKIVYSYDIKMCESLRL